MWKENVMEELEAGELEYESVEEFLTSLKKEFGRGEEKLVKVVELRKLEQGGKTMKDFVQEFKRGMNGRIRRKLMEVENPPTLIEQWY